MGDVRIRSIWRCGETAAVAIFDVCREIYPAILPHSCRYEPISSSHINMSLQHAPRHLPPTVVFQSRLISPRVKSSQGLLFSEAKKPDAEAVGQTGAQGLVRGCGPHCPPVSRKNPARDEASGAPRAGRYSASFSGLISGVRVLSPALSGGRPGFRGG